MKKNNILICTMDFPPNEGGMETCAYEISKELQNYYTVTVIAPETSKPKNKIDVQFNIHRINFPGNYILKILKLFFIILKIVLKQNIHIIYLNTWSPFGLPVLMISKLFKINYFITCHGLDIVEPQQSSFHRYIMKPVLKNAKNIFAVSNYTKNLILKYSVNTSDNIRVIHNGINPDKFISRNQNEINEIKSDHNLKDHFVLLSVSRLVPRKNHINVIKAVDLLIKQNYKIKYLIIGRGETEIKIREYIKNSKLENDIKLLGFIDDNSLINYYYCADIFIMPSLEILDTGDVEGFGVSYLEANITGLPVIGANNGGALEAIENNKSGLLVNPESIDDIKEKIELLIKKNNLKKKLGEQGKKRALEEFTWKKNIEKMLLCIKCTLS